MWNAEYNTYGNGSNINLTYKYDQDGTWKKYYNINDHLGNVRTVLRKEINPPATIVKQFDYAPFGKVLNTADVNRTKFIGKEKDKESNYADHGVRKYDDEIGRFTSIDPLWEKYYSLTPYQYAGNNPVSFLDPNGLFVSDKDGSAKIFIINEKPYIKSDNGKLLKLESTSMNCIGYALAFSNNRGPVDWIATEDNRYNIDPSDAKEFALKDGYNQKNGKLIEKNISNGKPNGANVGDVILYYNSGGELVHASVVNEIKSDGTVIVKEVESLGDCKKSVIHDLNTSKALQNGGVTKTTYITK